MRTSSGKGHGERTACWGKCGGVDEFSKGRLTEVDLVVAQAAAGGRHSQHAVAHAQGRHGRRPAARQRHGRVGGEAGYGYARGAEAKANVVPGTGAKGVFAMLGRGRSLHCCVCGDAYTKPNGSHAGPGKQDKGWFGVGNGRCLWCDGNSEWEVLGPLRPRDIPGSTPETLIGN
jgi:hypothetical protein